MILSIISQLAFISVYDKFILNSYDLENYDNLIIFTVIFFTLLRYKTHVNSKTS